MIRRIKTNCIADWKALRKKYIGGSDAAAVVGLNPFCSPWSLWAEKVGAAPDFEGNLATEVGAFLEAFIAAKFEELTGKTVRRRNLSIVNEKYPWAIANIDREVVGEDAGLEIKSTSVLATKKFANGEYPEQYYVQCMHYLAVTEKKKWYLAVLVGNRELHTFEIERDEAEIAALMEAEESFWSDHILERIPPEADGSHATTEAIAQTWPEGDAEADADLSGLEEIVANYIDLGEQIRALERAREAQANKIKAVMGDAQTGNLLGYSVSWKSSARESYDVVRFQKEHPEMDLSAYKKRSVFRAFKVTEKKERS